MLKVPIKLALTSISKRSENAKFKITILFDGNKH